MGQRDRPANSQQRLTSHQVTSLSKACNYHIHQLRCI